METYSRPTLAKLGKIESLVEASGSIGAGNVAGSGANDILIDNNGDGIGDELQIDGDPNNTVPVDSVQTMGGRLYDLDADGESDFFAANGSEEINPIE